MARVLLTVMALAFAAPAAAAPIITITYDGQFEAGFDVSTTNPSGYFGAGNNLTGVAARIVWTFDPALASISTSTPTHSSISGTPAQPVGTATVTVNGRSLAIAGNFQSSLSRTTNGSNGSLGINIYDQAPPFFGEAYAYTFFSAFSPAITTSQLDAGFTMTANGSTDRFLGDFRFLYNNYATGELQTVYGRIAPGVGTLTLSAANGVAVPEPATWAMLVVGFGLLGWAMRRRPVRARVIPRPANS